MPKDNQVFLESESYFKKNSMPVTSTKVEKPSKQRLRQLSQRNAGGYLWKCQPCVCWEDQWRSSCVRFQHQLLRLSPTQKRSPCGCQISGAWEHLCIPPKEGQQLVLHFNALHHFQQEVLNSLGHLGRVCGLPVGRGLNLHWNHFKSFPSCSARRSCITYTDYMNLFFCNNLYMYIYRITSSWSSCPGSFIDSPASTYSLEHLFVRSHVPGLLQNLNIIEKCLVGQFRTTVVVQSNHLRFFIHCLETR